MNLPLAVARGARLPGDPWSPRDWALAQACKRLDWSRCPGCGQPRWLSHDETSLYKPSMVKCEGCESIAIKKASKDVTALFERPDRYAEAYHFTTEHVGHQTKKRGRRGD